MILNPYVTTAGTIDGWRVEEHLGLVSAHVVAGTGFFSDMFAGFSDIFGGRSQSYRKQLASLQQEVVAELMLEGKRRGGNWVIGVRVDMDEISGQGKQMFMVTAIGTVVRAAPVTTSAAGTATSGPVIDADVVGATEQRHSILLACKEGTLTLNDEAWRFVIEHRIAEAATTVLRLIRGSSPEAVNVEQRLDERAIYFEALHPEQSGPVLYEALEDDDSRMAGIASALISRLGLARLDLVLALLDHPQVIVRIRALNTLRVHQISYTDRDVGVAEALLAKLSSPSWPQAEIHVGKGRFGKEKKTWQCVGCANNERGDTERCFACGRDRQGFFQADLAFPAAREILTARIQALREIFPNVPQ